MRISRKMSLFVVLIGFSINAFAQTNVKIDYRRNGNRDYFLEYVSLMTMNLENSNSIVEKQSSRETQAISNVLNQLWNSYDVDPNDIFTIFFVLNRQSYVLFYHDDSDKYLIKLFKVF